MGRLFYFILFLSASLGLPVKTTCRLPLFLFFSLLRENVCVTQPCVSRSNLDGVDQLSHLSSLTLFPSSMATTTADNDVQVFPPPAFKPLLDEIAAQLVSHGATIAIAETSTGGLISAALLSVPGASKFYVGGATVYTPTSRKAWAGWDDQVAKHYLSVPFSLPLGVLCLTMRADMIPDGL